MSTDPACAAFQDQADELALGFTDAHARDGLLAHAQACARCGRLLQELTTTVDRMLELGPEVEPPVGFESRAVAAMRPAPAPAPRRVPARLAAAAAVAVVLLGGAVAVALVRGGSGGEDRAARQSVAAEVRSASGEPFGRVELLRSPQPRVVVLLDGPADWSGTWACELRAGDGRWVEVGRWTAADASAGVWATRIDATLVDATAMRITTATGRVIASADLRAD